MLGFLMMNLSRAQNFGNCDFYKELTPGVVYSFNSPNYNDPYPPGALCRYTGIYIYILSDKIQCEFHRIKSKTFFNFLLLTILITFL